MKTIMQEMEERHAVLKNKWNSVKNMQIGVYFDRPSKVEIAKFAFNVNRALCDISHEMTLIESEMLKHEARKEDDF